MGLLTNGSVIFTWILFISTVEGIRDGYNATKDQFPYHAHIEVYKHTVQIGICNGAVISTTLIITSYGCVWRGTRFIIALADFKDNPYQINPDYNYALSNRFYTPPSLIMSNSLTTGNYVALLQVETEIPFNDVINRIAIPINQIASTDLTRIPPLNSYAYATYYRIGKEHLQWLNMRIVSLSECTDTFPGDLFKYSLCARGEDTEGHKRGSLCREENVPLVYNNTLIGISKMKDLPCEDGRPNLFIDVQHFSNWIDNTITNINSGRAIYNAIEKDFPYHAHIEVYGSAASNTNNCSGAVLNSKFVITSKDCVWSGKSFRIRLGSLNPGEEDDNPAYNHVTKLAPLFPPQTIISDEESPDIWNPLLPALLEVEEEILFNDYIQPVRLPKPENILLDDRYGIASGYLSDEPKHLQWLNMEVVPLTNCFDINTESVLLNSICVHTSIGYNGTESLCNEQGVPLVLSSDRKTLVGISAMVANEETCKSGASKNLFVDIKIFVDWINNTINNKISSGIVMHNATRNQFSYQAHIEVIRLVNIRNCSGAVINSKFIITSKDCVWSANTFRIKLGSLNPFKADDNPAYNHLTHILPVFPSDDSSSNPQYPNRNPMLPALLQVEREIHFTNRIQPVKLPGLEYYSLDSTYDAFATGYYSKEQRHLQWLNMQVIPNCTNRFPSSWANGGLCVISKTSIGYNNTGNLCKDQGVPLILNSDRKTLFGISTKPNNIQFRIVSRGNDDHETCKNSGNSNLFIAVQHFTNWIMNTTTRLR